jgi:anti-sigma-K factor RskA
MDITHNAPGWRAEEIAMAVVATVMLTAIVLYMLQQVQDL